MKVLYYTSCSYFYPGIGVVINQVIEDIKNGNTVYWSFCNKALSKCHFSNGQAFQCKLCQNGYSQLKKAFKEKVIFIEVIRKQKNIDIPQFSDFDAIKNFQYRGAKIGYGILSTYISGSRDNDGYTISPRLKDFVKVILPELCSCTDAVFDIVDKYKPDHIKIYNGRLHENRFVYDISKIRNIKFSSLEVSGGFNEPFYPMEYKGALPHSVKLFTEMTHSTWDLSGENEEIKILKGKGFYEKRKNGISAGDKVYISGQTKGLIPDSYDNKKYNVVIFNSSADEISALGEEWEESTKLFKTQYDACVFILENTSKDIQYYLRLHPNLKGVTYKYVTDLYLLESKYKNIHVIAPESTISSYALLDIADKVITFGSTMGVEATYWNKVSIMVGMSFYKYLDVSYNPDSVEDLLSLIEDRQLKPKNQYNTLRYAYFLMDRKYSISPENNININPQNIGTGKFKIQTFDIYKTLGSTVFFGILRFLAIHVFK